MKALFYLSVILAAVAVRSIVELTGKKRPKIIVFWSVVLVVFKTYTTYYAFFGH